MTDSDSITNRKLMSVTFKEAPKGPETQGKRALESVIFDVVNKAANRDLTLAHSILRALNGDSRVEEGLRYTISEYAKTGLGHDIKPDSEVMDNVFGQLKSQAHFYQKKVNHSKELLEAKRRKTRQIAGGLAATVAVAGGAAFTPQILSKNADAPAIVRPAELFDLPSPVTLISEAPEQNLTIPVKVSREFSLASSEDIKALLGASELSGDALELRDSYLDNDVFHSPNNSTALVLDLPIGNQDFRDSHDDFPLAVAYRLSQTQEFMDLNDQTLLGISNKVVDQARELRSLYTGNRKRPPSPLTPVVIEHPSSTKKHVLLLNDALVFNEPSYKTSKTRDSMINYFPLSLAKAHEIAQGGYVDLSAEEMNDAKQGNYVIPKPQSPNSNSKTNPPYAGSKF